MAEFENDDLEYVDDYLNEFEQQHQQIEEDTTNEVSSDDTSAGDARNGKDIQGIPWERMNFTRDKYRERRLKHYKNYLNLSPCNKSFHKECKEVETTAAFYDFQFNTRRVKSTIVHFQGKYFFTSYMSREILGSFQDSHLNGHILVFS